ncbi:MAG: hypothetical protein K9M54_10265 [Kiritimatiellales bacterium]|nr:hypothetical protein [Kiritimatiellales bacterium]
MTPIPKHILIFEPLSGGHRAEFIGHLIDYIVRENPADQRYTFVVANGFGNTYGEILELAASPGIILREVSPSQARMLDGSRGPLGGFAFWRILDACIGELMPDHVIVMDLTWMELPLCFHRPPCPFSGILFVQYPELRSLSRRSFRRQGKFVAKEIKTRLLLRNPMLRRIFLLNGSVACDYLNCRFGVTCFSPIPDPVPVVVAEPNFSLRRQYGIEAGRRVYLFFCSMSVRKGVGVLVEAMALLSREAAQNSAFIFCGMPEPGYAKRFHAMCRKLVNKRPDVLLHLEEQFVSSVRMRAMFEQADWILMPYIRPEYSSGILAHAASAATPVIGPVDGLIGRQIREHRLGRSVDITSKALLGAIEAAIKEDYAFNETARQAFVEASSPEQFAATLLGI